MPCHAAAANNVFSSQEFDIKFEPLDSIHPKISTSSNFQSLSVVSQLNRLGDFDGIASIIQLKEMSHHYPPGSCDVDSHTKLDHHSDSGSKQMNSFTDEGIDEDAGGGLQHATADSSSHEMSNRPHVIGSDSDGSFRVQQDLSTIERHRSKMPTQKSCDLHQTSSCHFCESSVSELHNVYITGSGFTDTAGYIVCAVQSEQDQI